MRPLPAWPLLAFILPLFNATPLSANPSIRWSRLADIPDPRGFAGSFVGVSHDTLLFAGGANFAGSPAWAGGRKSWYDTVYALARPGGTWRLAGHLAQPRAYGVTVTTAAGVVCAGGGDEHANVAEVTLLSWDGTAVQTKPLPAMPRRCAFSGGALIGTVLYVVGGIETPAATEAMDSLWALDVAAPDAGWKILPPLPGPGRILPVVGADAKTLYVFSGASLHADAHGTPARAYLRDAYAFTPRRGWRRLADLPRAAVAAPSPAPLAPDGRLLVISGDDGTRLALFGPHHPGFARDVLAYDPLTNRWQEAGTAPFSRATTTTVPWHQSWIIPSGERIPGVRSPAVWALRFDAPPP